MAFKFSLVRPSDGKARNGYFGFAWTTLWFGPIASIARRDFGIALLLMAFEIALCLLIYFLYDSNVYLLVVRLAIVSFCWALLYNEMHSLALVTDGFRFHGPDEVVAALNHQFPVEGRKD